MREKYIQEVVKIFIENATGINEAKKKWKKVKSKSNIEKKHCSRKKQT